MNKLIILGEFLNDKKHGNGKLHKSNGEIEKKNYQFDKDPERIERKSFHSLRKEEDSSPKTDYNLPPETEIKTMYSKGDNIKEHTPSENELEKSKLFSNTGDYLDEKSHFSEFKSDIKTLDIGIETLSLIEQIEMMNSLNSSLLNKNSKKYP